MRPRQHTDFIKGYSGALAAPACEALIARFEADTAHHEIKRVEGGYSFVQLDVTAAWPDVDAQIEPMFNAAYNRYRAELGLERFWPQVFFHEHLRLKRYLPDGRDEFPPHVDVMDAASAVRFCTAILYLNDPGGGETVFPDIGLKLAPQPGNLIVFPPYWNFPHAGLPPTREAKYILHSYLRFPPPG